MAETAELAAWLAGRLPSEWFAGEPEIVVDREEITVVGELRTPGRGDPALAIESFRERTRDTRVAIASEAERRYGLRVAWGATCAGSRQLFSRLSVPVMTRLRQEERLVLDTLVAAGVARSRSDALAWCVRLVGRHEDDWIVSLQDALVAVQRARAKGPDR